MFISLIRVRQNDSYVVIFNTADTEAALDLKEIFDFVTPFVEIVAIDSNSSFSVG